MGHHLAAVLWFQRIVSKKVTVIQSPSLVIETARQHDRLPLHSHRFFKAPLDTMVFAENISSEKRHQKTQRPCHFLNVYDHFLQ